jgi:hypothetical protein
MQMVPASELAQTKFIRLNKFTAEQIASFHKKLELSPSPDSIRARRRGGVHVRECHLQRVESPRP